MLVVYTSAMKKLAPLSLLLLSFLGPAEAAPAPPKPEVYVGILEDDRSTPDLPDAPSKPGKVRVVRMAFASRDGVWRKHDEANGPRTWTIAFDGKKIGEIKTDPRPAGQTERGRGVFGIRSAKVPVRGKASPDYSGWPGGLARRPLVALSAPNVKDPDGWRPGKLSAAEKKKIWELFPKPPAPSAAMCPDGNNKPAWPGEPFPESSLVVGKVYVSKADQKIAGASLKNPYPGCDTDPQQPRNHWFKISAANTSEFGADLTPVDAGDYDGDGQSEFIFFKSGYNRDGYIIYANDFENSAELNWSYH